MIFTGNRSRIGIALFALSLSSSSMAEPMVSDTNCNKAEFSDMQQFQNELCQAHLGCRLTAALGEKGCSAVRFFRNIGDIFTRKPEIDNNDVVDAFEPEYPQTHNTRRIVSKAREASTQVGTKGQNTKNLIIAPGNGSYASYDGGWDHTSGAASGGGTLISTSGRLRRGNWENGALSGPGQSILNGSVEGGEYQGGSLQGDGFRASPVNGQMETMEGTFDKGVPVGEVVVTLADGSRRRELWADGKRIAIGQTAPKGKVPPDLADPRLAVKTAPAAPKVSAAAPVSPAVGSSASVARQSLGSRQCAASSNQSASAAAAELNQWEKQYPVPAGARNQLIPNLQYLMFHERRWGDIINAWGHCFSKQELDFGLSQSDMRFKNYERTCQQMTTNPGVCVPRYPW